MFDTAEIDDPMNPNSFWAGEFGNAYTARNRVDWRARIPFWREIIDLTGARSVHEVGCNAGWNLSAIRRACPDVRVTGEEINQTARRQAWECDLDVGEPGLPLQGQRDLVFTAGLLIHIAPCDLPRMMRDIVASSAQYVLAVEYESEIEEAVEYRGHEDKLWKRPYGKLYADMGLKLTSAWVEPEGFDRCTAWLLEKP